ncbi:hypothetical protein [Actinomadura keratinilytica]|uniref:hypothetical protein n=1 Tax=Actinomadura keratinilytica TaxID=547461 RepID=UPI0036132617
MDAGVTERVPAPKTPCGRGPLLRLEGADGTRTVGDLGFPRPAVLTQRPAASDPDARRPAPDGRGAKDASGARAAAPLTADGVRLWDRVACALPRPERPVTEASARQFWTGALPHGGGTAEWVCTNLSFTAGGPAGEATLLRRGAHHATGSCDAARPVSGTWWQAPSGRWYYLAAAGPGLVPHIQSEGRCARPRSGAACWSPPAPARPTTPASPSPSPPAPAEPAGARSALAYWNGAD